jgi:hypothetical protein
MNPDAKARAALFAFNWVAMNNYFKQLNHEDVLIINGMPFVIRPASPDDIERIGTGRVIDE